MLSKKFTKEETSWIMYDWANGAFTTIMIAAVFPAYFVGITYGDTLGSMWWAIGLIIARVTVGILAPFIGAFIEYKGYKKKLFVIFLSLGLIATAYTAFVDSWQLLLIGYVIANIFWSACNQIYDAFLPDITTKNNMDKVSTTGFAYGYIGGSTIPFVGSIILIMFGNIIGINATMAVRISIIITALWWGIFSIPFILNVHHKYEKEMPKKGAITQTFKRMIKTAKEITGNKGLLYFMIAYFFYIDGVGTIINLATAFGAEIGLDTTSMMGALIITQLVAFPFSLLFGKLSKKVGNINLIIYSILLYIIISVVGFTMGFGLETNLFDVDTALILFWILAFLVGTVQGGIQAISRSTYGKLIPADKSGDFFGFYEIFGRFAAILGPAVYAITLDITGRPSFSILSVIIVFVIGLVTLLIGKKHIMAILSIGLT